MELQIAKDKIKSSRIKRAWSQDHLAQVSGLGIRTVQRIESTGFASYDSAKAIASALEIPVSELTGSDTTHNSSGFIVKPGRKLKYFSATTILGALAILLARGAIADQITLDLGVSINDESVAENRLVTDEGVEAVLQVDEKYQISITPVIAGSDKVHLQLRLLEYDGESYIPFARPRLVTRNSEVVEVRSIGEDQSSIAIRILPSLD